MRKILLSLAVLMFTLGTANAQSLTGALKRAAETAVQNHITKTQGSEQVAEEATVEEPASVSETPAAAPQTRPQSIAKYNKFDFVAGDQIIFDDQQIDEPLGEFPSMWDLRSGEAEIAQVNGENVIALFEGGIICPLMKDEYNYLGDVFTIEFDYYLNYKPNDDERNFGGVQLRIAPIDNSDYHSDVTFEMYFENYYTQFDKETYNKTNFSYSWTRSNEERQDGETGLDIEPNNWHHVSLSFNKRAMKVYIDETRIANIPNMIATSGWLYLEYLYADHENPAYIKDIRIAKGAVPLYDRVMSDGRFITYGIWFEVGKSDIRPESMGEINRIYKMLTDNPALKFEVEGHTDATGNANANLTLSEARARAIVNKLVEMGISRDRLTAVGKGQSSPISDNSTPESRAKNRRVEFVKF